MRGVETRFSACVAGVLSLQHEVMKQCTVRRMLREQLQAAQASKLLAEKEHALAAASAATFQHELELLKHEVMLHDICAGNTHILNASYAQW